MIRLINMLFVALFAVSAHAIDLKSVRSSADQDSSRVVLEFSGKPQFSHFNLNNPSRLVLDITNLRAKRLSPLIRLMTLESSGYVVQSVGTVGVWCSI